MAAMLGLAQPALAQSVAIRPAPKDGWKYAKPEGFAVAENNARAANNFLIEQSKRDEAALAKIKAIELTALDETTRKNAAKLLREFEPLAPFIRFATFYNAPVDLLAEWRSDFVFSLNHLHRKQSLVLPVDVPGTEGRLVWWDIRDAGWSIAAVQAAFEREPFCLAPHLLGETAARMNLLLGLKNFSQTRLHCLGMVRADWLIRETGETLRSTTYYDLFFAPERFPELPGAKGGDPFTVAQALVPGLKRPKVKRLVQVEAIEKETKWEPYKHTGGKLPGFGDKEYPPGMYELPREVEKKVVKTEVREVDDTSPSTVIVPNVPRVLKGLGSANAKGQAVVDFPQNEGEWEKAFGVDKVKELQKAQALDLENGAVVDGFEAGGSIVARQNRLLLRLPAVTGKKSSYYWKTFDADKTLAEQNYFQTLVFDFKFKAGEVIASTPCGAQAYGLFNNKGERAEFVPEELAIDRTDKYDHRVRNPGSCIVCHTSGINAPDDLVNKFFKQGGIFSALSKEKQDKVKTYFVKWETKLRADQESYAEFVKDTTKRTPAQNASSYASMREYYDDPVTLVKAAVELGTTTRVVRILARKSAEARVVSQALLRPFPVPRTTWDGEVFPVMILLMDAFRSAEIPPEALNDEERLAELIEKALQKLSKPQGKEEK
jgi:hypothetical protein